MLRNTAGLSGVWFKTSVCVRISRGNDAEDSDVIFLGLVVALVGLAGILSGIAFG
jgi:hypothetical protein